MENVKTQILLVEDDPNLGTLLQEYLEAKGFETKLATDGKKGFDSFCKQEFDLLLLDVMMPVVSGVDILKLIRKHEELAQLPVLILTASCDRTTKLTVLNLGATDFLTKPIDPSEMAPRIRNVLSVNYGLSDQRTGACFGRDVAQDEFAVASGSFDQGHRLLAAVLVEVAEDQPGSFFREPNGSGSSEPRAGASDDRDLAREPHLPHPSPESSR